MNKLNLDISTFSSSTSLLPNLSLIPRSSRLLSSTFFLKPRSEIGESLNNWLVLISIKAWISHSVSAFQTLVVSFSGKVPACKYLYWVYWMREPNYLLFLISSSLLLLLRQSSFSSLSLLSSSRFLRLQTFSFTIFPSSVIWDMEFYRLRDVRLRTCWISRRCFLAFGFLK